MTDQNFVSSAQEKEHLLERLQEELQRLVEAQTLKPESMPIIELHRGKDGFVTFGRKPTLEDSQKGKSLENLFAIRADDLKDMFPVIRDWLISDSYFSVNGMYRTAFYKHKPTGLWGPNRRESNLRYLNACYVDLDVGRSDSSETSQQQTWQETVAHVIQLMDRGILPQASIIARSGRGLYLFWLLIDTRNPAFPAKRCQDGYAPGTPQRSYPEKISLYKRVNKKLGAILAEHAPDLGAHAILAHSMAVTSNHLSMPLLPPVFAIPPHLNM